jgi:hypothetical protein
VRVLRKRGIGGQDLDSWRSSVNFESWMIEHAVCERLFLKLSFLYQCHSHAACGCQFSKSRPRTKKQTSKMETWNFFVRLAEHMAIGEANGFAA